MTVPSPKARELACSILEHETGEDASPDAMAQASRRAIRKFHGQLIRLIGSGGFEALESRALDLAAGQHPFLANVETTAPSEGRRALDTVLLELDPPDARAGAEAVLAHLIDLLFTFLGGEVGGRLVRQAWPKLDSGKPPGNPRKEP